MAQTHPSRRLCCKHEARAIVAFASRSQPSGGVNEALNTAADKTGLIAARGPVIVAKAALGFDASVNDLGKKAAKHTQLAAAGLVARETA